MEDNWRAREKKNLWDEHHHHPSEDDEGKQARGSKH